MVRVVPLAAIANQSFTVTIDGARWALSVKEALGVMCVNVARDGVVVLLGTRALAGEAIIPYRYLEAGNFLFLVAGDALPAWREFGATQILVFLSATEMAALPTITAGEIEAAQHQIQYIFTDEGFYVTTDTGELIEEG